MTATSFDLSAIKTDVLSSAANFRQLIGLGSSATLNAGSANGVATLGADSKLTAAQVPDISLISYLGSVASQAAMLALSGQQGDWCVRSDLSTTWVITGSDPTLLANWTQLSYPSVPVQSVFGRTGAVVGVSTDYSSVGITNTAIGASNPSTGAFTTLSANSATLSTGTITSDTPAINITQTWNNNAVAFTGLKLNVTDTASNAASLLMDLQVGGTSRFRIRKDGGIFFGDLSFTVINGGVVCADSTVSEARSFRARNIAADKFIMSGGSFNGQQLSAAVNETGGIGTFNSGFNGYAPFACAAAYLYSTSGTSMLVSLIPDAANTLAQRNGTNAQTFRIYNTYTDASNYERAKIAWSSNVLQIGTEKLGTGAARALELQTDGTTRQTIAADGTEVRWKLASGRDVYIDNNGNIQFTFSGSGLVTTGNVFAGAFFSNIYGATGGDNQLVTYCGARPVSSTLGARLVLASSANSGTNGIFNLLGATHTNDLYTIRDSTIVGVTAFATATTNISGGAVQLAGGAGASASAGAANGGHVYLDGGQGYGTGVHGSIIIGATRARLLAFGGTTSSFPAIKRNSAALNFRLADDSADCDITAAKATLSATLDLTIRTVTYGATMAIDAALGNKIAITLGGNGTISNPTNAVDGRVLVFRLRQDATGSRIPVWDTKYSFVGDLATVTLSTAANKIDRVAFEYDSTDDKWYCISFIKGS